MRERILDGGDEPRDEDKIDCSVTEDPIGNVNPAAPSVRRLRLHRDRLRLPSPVGSASGKPYSSPNRCDEDVSIMALTGTEPPHRIVEGV